MKFHQRALSIISAGCLSVFSMAPVPAWAALPSPVKAGHPRLLLSTQRIDEVRAVTAPPLTSAFPRDRGRLTFDIVPVFSATASDLTPVIDDYNEGRNHLFIRHVAQNDNRANGTASFQITLQAPAGYVSNVIVNLRVDELSTVVVSWDNGARQTLVSVNSGSANVQQWGAGSAWRVDGENFVIRGRAGEQIRRLQVVDLSTGSVVLERGPIDIRLQDALQQLLGSGGSLESQVNGLLNCVNGNDPGTCKAPFDLGTSQPGTIEDTARRLALAYRLSGEARYLDAARHYAGLLLTVPPGRGGDYAMSGRVGAFSILYDWLFEPMHATPAYASGFASLADQIAQRAIDHIVAAPEVVGDSALGAMACGNQPIYATPTLHCAVEPMVNWDRQAYPYGPSIANTYLGGGHTRDDGARIVQALLAIVDERGDTLPLLETMYRHFDEGYQRARQWLSVDGAHHMNYGYGQNYNNPMFAESLWQSALQPVSDRPVMEAAWEYKTWVPYLYALRGDNRFPSTGDGAGPFLPDISSFVLKAVSGVGDGQAQAFYEQLILPLTGPGVFRQDGQAERYLWDRLFFGNSLIAPASFEELPLARHFRNAGFVTMRDRWTFEDATLLDFKSTSFTSQNHHHFDQNSFSLFYRAPLLLDSGFYAAYGDTHWRNYLIRTIAHNSMVVFDPGETFVMDGLTHSNDGGQWLQSGMQTYPTMAEAQSGPNRLHGVEAFAQGTDFSYVRANASRAYSPAKLNQSSGFIRHVIMLRQPSFWPLPVIVMFDQIKLQVGRESLKPVVLFHTTNEPVPIGEAPRGAGVFDLAFANGARKILDVKNGHGRVFVETLSPESASVRKLGGVGSTGDFRFTVPTLAADGSFPLVNYLPNATSEQLGAPDIGAWRIEIGAAGANTTREFLHVMSVAEATDVTASQAPIALRLNASTGSAAVLLADTMAVLIFNGAATATVFVDVPAGTHAHELLAVGLQPGERFNAVTNQLGNGALRVTFVRSSGGSLQASDEGALRVTTN